MPYAFIFVGHKGLSLNNVQWHTNVGNSHYEKFADGTVKCIDDEIPFEIPQGWEWARLGYVFAHNTGKALNGAQKDGTHLRYITTSNLYWDRFELSETREMYFSDSEVDKCTVVKGDLLVCEGGDIGRAAIWNKDYSICIQNHIHRLRAYFSLCTRFFYYVFLLYKGLGNIGGKGIGIQGLSSGALHNILLPIPPINEQERIVGKLDEVIAYVNKYEQSQERLDVLNESINDRLRKSILQEAIQGRLVPQDPNEEPATVLLERIREEKQKLLKEGKIKKKDIVDSVIFKGEDNKYYEKVGRKVLDISKDIPFDIPDSWRWIRLGALFAHNTGKALNRADTKGILRKYLTTSNVYWNRFDFTEVREMFFLNSEMEKCSVQRGDLLVCEGGDIGRAAIWNFDEEICIQNHIHRLRAYYPISIEFYCSVFALYKGIGQIGGKGIGIQGLSSGALHNLILPVPPIAEQERIITRLNTVIASTMRK
ncbi:MAG: restriction endonuclease subunit S [Bacteroidales bacterium]|nr:restriction endonuclease subunit S [Bacteroidales bacterium]